MNLVKAMNRRRMLRENWYTGVAEHLYVAGATNNVWNTHEEAQHTTEWCNKLRVTEHGVLSKHSKITVPAGHPDTRVKRMLWWAEPVQAYPVPATLRYDRQRSTELRVLDDGRTA